jgi:predicted RNA binding protein YcfA (HicA-like mRNA interferase family)
MIKALQLLGWSSDRQKGSHISLVKEGPIYVLTIPDHDTDDRE